MSGRMGGLAGVVTGATKGLGRETALLLAEEGASIVGVGRDSEDGRRLEEDSREFTGDIAFVSGDVRDEDTSGRAIQTCLEQFGRFDIMVANAGILGPETPLHETDAKGFDEVVDVNVRGLFFNCRAAVTAMLEGGGGSIVTVGSILSVTADPMLTSYTATKAAVLGLTKAIAVDYADRGIRCNCVLPGDMETPMIDAYFAATGDPAAARAEMERTYPIKRLAQPREVAYAIRFLASPESSYVTGTHLLVDGGLVAKAY